MDTPAEGQAKSEITAHCPKCGRTEIMEKNVAYASLEVTGWELRDGDLNPTDYGSADAEWETADARHQYVCNDCAWEGAIDDLVVKEIAS